MINNTDLEAMEAQFATHNVYQDGLPVPALTNKGSCTERRRLLRSGGEDTNLEARVSHGGEGLCALAGDPGVLHYLMQAQSCLRLLHQYLHAATSICQ